MIYNLNDNRLYTNKSKFGAIVLIYILENIEYSFNLMYKRENELQ